METIGKFRTNFLGKGKSFKIGFNNRSPFSYISSTGPEVPSRYDGGVPLVNFTPDQYAKAFDTSNAVRAEHEMYKKAGEAAGKAVGAIAGFRPVSEEQKKGVDEGMGDITKKTSSSANNSGVTVNNITPSSNSSGGGGGGNQENNDNNYYRYFFNQKSQQYGQDDTVDGDGEIVDGIDTL